MERTGRNDGISSRTVECRSALRHGCFSGGPRQRTAPRLGDLLGRSSLRALSVLRWEKLYDRSLHPAAPHHLPAFITAPGETDVLMVVMAVFLIVAVLGRRPPVPAPAYAARAHGAQVPEDAVRDRRRAGPAGPLHAHASLLGRRPAACPDRPPRFRLAARAGWRGRSRRWPASRRARARPRLPTTTPPVSVPAESPAAGSDESVASTPREVRPQARQASLRRAKGLEPCLSFFSAPC